MFFSERFPDLVSNKNDPGAFVLSIVLKIFCIIVCYSFLAFYFKLASEIFFWVVYILCCSAVICARSSSTEVRKQCFYITWVSSALMLVFSEYLFVNQAVSTIALLCTSYLLMYVRENFARYKSTASFLVIILANLLLRSPFPASQSLSLIISIIFCGSMFFMLVVNAKANISVLYDYLKLEHQVHCQNIKNILNQISPYSDDFAVVILNQRDNMINAYSLISDRGQLWLDDKEKINLWCNLCRNIKIMLRNVYQILFAFQAMLNRREQGVSKMLKDTKIYEHIRNTSNLVNGLFYLKEEEFYGMLQKCQENNQSLEMYAATINDIDYDTMLYEIILVTGSVHFISESLKKELVFVKNLD